MRWHTISDVKSKIQGVNVTSIIIYGTDWRNGNFDHET